MSLTYRLTLNRDAVIFVAKQERPSGTQTQIIAGLDCSTTDS